MSFENMPVRGKFLANTVEEIEMIQKTTGCSLTIDTGHGNTCGNLEEMTEGDELSMSKVVRLMLGKENRKKLYDSIRHEDGRVPLEEVDKCITEIMMLLGEQGKNS